MTLKENFPGWFRLKVASFKCNEIKEINEELMKRNIDATDVINIKRDRSGDYWYEVFYKEDRFVEIKKKPDVPKSVRPLGAKLDKKYHGSKLPIPCRHLLWEQRLNLDPGHVIIDLEVYNQLLDQLGF